MNNKGFMMAEVVVVSAIVLVVMAALYLSYNKIYKLYSTRLDYYDTVTLYRLGYYRDIMIENKIMNDALTRAKSERVIEIYNSTSNNGNVFSLPSSETLTDVRDTVFLVYAGKAPLSNGLLGNYEVNPTYKDYVTFLSTSFTPKSNYVMLLERCAINNLDDCKYAYLEIYDGAANEIDYDSLKNIIGVNSVNDTYVFASSIERTKIEKVVFKNTLETDIDASKYPIDISLNGDKSVMAYFENSDGDELREMYITADGKITSTNLAKLFYGFTNLETIEHIEYLDTSYATNFNGMFTNCEKLTGLDLSSFNTSNAKSMSSMFWGTKKLTDFSSLSSFDMSHVEDISYMFGMPPSTSKTGNPSISVEFLRNWNVSNVTNMAVLFQNVNLVSYEPFANWNVGKVQSFNNTFNQSTNATVTTLSGLENWNVSSATNMNSMFADNSALTDASAINNWDIGNVTNFTKMFQKATVYPTFNKRPGTWKSDGTYTPN